MGYRNLSQAEILALENQNCNCQDWSKVQVKDPFNVDRIHHVSFYGNVRLGVFTDSVNRPGGIVLPAGISYSKIHNCTIGDNVYIADAGHIANYEIRDNVFIENTCSMIVDGESSFGNGVEIEVLNEGGGRTLTLYDRLSSQIAYLMVLYRHDKKLIERLGAMIGEYVKTKTSAMGTIGEHSTIVNCKELIDIHVGPHAVISGANYLKNGTIASNEHDPCFIGDAVYARNFIVQSGSKIDSRAIVTSTFVGQGVKIEKQFSAENSAFFANCEAMHGEACSVFGGPYTVSHHKSTLLIAGLFSFYNAGSGTNQSNHMYKLGPVHQGIFGRGTKTGSFSYLLLPCHIGPFSVILGKHYIHLDTADLPFSYIFEEEGKSIILPGRNLITVGPRRDSMKWPTRDRRKDPEKFDLINYDLRNPKIVGKMIRGIEILKELASQVREGQKYVNYQSAWLPASKLESCGKFYESCIKIFVGDCVMEQLEKLNGKETFEAVKKGISPNRDRSLYDWRDLSGLIAPTPDIKKLITSISDGQIKTVDDLLSQLKTLFDLYQTNKWIWCCNLIEKLFDKKFKDLTNDDFKTIVSDWKQSGMELNDAIAQDALKEFGRHAQIGFGVDDGDSERERDFEAVRGKAETNSVIEGLKEENKLIEKRADKIMRFLKKK